MCMHARVEIMALSSINCEHSYICLAVVLFSFLVNTSYPSLDYNQRNQGAGSPVNINSRCDHEG